MRQPSTPMPGLRQYLYVLVSLVVLGVATAAIAVERNGPYGSDPPAPSQSVVFYYEQIDAPRQAANFRGARAVVTSGQRDDARAVQIIHSAGAMAIKYVNAYWFPADRVYQGIDIGRHMNWALCARGRRPLLGRTEGSERWYYLDANERPARAALVNYLRRLKTAGYDGVFFDRGSPSLRASAGIAIAWQRSNCTDEPVQPGRPRFANVFVSLLRQAKEQLHLTVFLNYGHPFTAVRLRPDPDDSSCRTPPRARCHYLSDVLSVIDGVVDENQNDDRSASGFLSEYREDMAAERHGSGGAPLVVRGIKVASRDRSLAFYRWARVRLFDVATFVNTGDDNCPTATGACFRYGTYPELTRLRLGDPLGAKPAAWSCDSRKGPPACVWVRRYGAGVTVLNATDQPRRVRIGLGAPSCRYIEDVYASTPSGPRTIGGGCLRGFSYRMPPWSGRVFVYSRERWHASAS